MSPGRLGPDGPPASRLSRLVYVCVYVCIVWSGAERFSQVINIIGRATWILDGAADEQFTRSAVPIQEVGPDSVG